MNLDAARVARFVQSEETARSATVRLRAAADELGAAWDRARRAREAGQEDAYTAAVDQAEVARERRDHERAVAQAAADRALAAERELRVVGLNADRVREVAVLGLDAAPANERTEAALVAWAARREVPASCR